LVFSLHIQDSLLIGKHNFNITFRPVRNAVHNLAEEEEDDVKRERQRVVSGTGSCTDAMRLVNLTKVLLLLRKICALRKSIRQFYISLRSMNNKTGSSTLADSYF